LFHPEKNLTKNPEEYVILVSSTHI